MNCKWMSATLALLLPLMICAQQQPAPENPVACKYLLKHSGLKGRVKKVTVKDSTGKVISQEGYDPKGRLTRKLVGSGRYAVLDNFSYDTAARAIIQKKEYATGEKIIYKYVYNDQGEVTAYYISNQAGNMFYTQRMYQYRDRLLATDSAYNPSASDGCSVYQYNSMGQVVTAKTYIQQSKVLVEETNYEYKMQDGLLLVKIQARTDYSGQGKFESKTSIKYFDKRVSLVKEQHIGATAFSFDPRELTFQLDTAGNWISNSKKETREMEYYPAAAEVAKAPAMAAIQQDLQTSLMLDENFDNNNNKWAEWDNEGSAAKISNGHYRVTVKQNNNYASWLGLPAFAADQSGDFTIEARYLLHSSETGHSNDSYWLLWGIGNEGKEFYAFGIYPDGKFHYGKQTTNAWIGLTGYIRSAYIQPGINKANVLRVEKRKSDLFLIINGKEVYKAAYEPFPISHAGVGFQFNIKKQVDIDYLRVYKGKDPAVVATATDPYGAVYERELSAANDSKARAAALSKYLNDIFVRTDSLEFTKLLTARLQQMAGIDFYAISEMLTGNKGPHEYRIRTRVLQVLPADQRQIIMAYSQCVIDNYQLRQQNKPEKSCPPADLPQPGYGLGKKVSSNKPAVAVVPNNGSNSQPPAIRKDPPADPLKVLREKAGNLQGQKIYVVREKATYFLPEKITISSLTDMVTLTGIGGHFTYSYSAGRNVFGIRTISSMTLQVKMADIIRGIENVSGYYLVTELGPCNGCGGGGGSWNNSTRTRSYCKHCGATGCVPTAIWNNGSGRAF